MSLRHFAIALVMLIFASPWLPAQKLQPSRQLKIDRIYSLFGGKGAAKPDVIGQCFTWNDVAYTMNNFERSPANLTQLSSLLNSLPVLDPNYLPNYQISGTNGRWTRNATNGNNIPIRTPITLTYSFIPDGTSIPSTGGSEVTGPSNFFASMNASFPGGTAAWKAQFAAAFARLSELTAVRYIEVADDGASFPDSAGQLGARGDIRIGMHSIDGGLGANILAYNYFPNTADMVLDSDNISFWVSSSNNFRNLRQVVMHEHGHGLGYDHVDPLDNTKLMEAQYSSSFDGPQEDDIRGFQRQYLDTREQNNSTATAADVGVLPASLSNLAIEDDALIDYYSFTAAAGDRLDITVAPVGTTYMQGPQGGAVAEFNAQVVHDLNFDILATNGSTVLQAVNATGPGQPESLTRFLASQAGKYYVRVKTDSTTDDIQRYQLAIQLTSEPNLTVTPDHLDLGQWDVRDSGGVTQSLTLRNDGTAPLTFGSPGLQIVGSDEYSLLNLPAPLLPLIPGASYMLNVRFEPRLPVGVRLAALRVQTNDPDQPSLDIALQGEAVPVELSFFQVE